MSRRNSVRTPEEVVASFRESGVTIKDWAERNGFKPSAVYTVLNDSRPAVRGDSHRIAVALGLKRRVAAAETATAE